MGGTVTRALQRLRDGVVALAILALALLIVAKLENDPAVKLIGQDEDGRSAVLSAGIGRDGLIEGAFGRI